MEYVKIEDVASICRGASPRPINFYITKNSDGINWIKIGDVDDNSVYINKTEEKITKDGAMKSRFVKKGDFILSNSMSFGRPYILNIDGCVHDGWLILSDYEKYMTQKYFYYVLRSNNTQKQFNKYAQGATVKNLNSDIVRKTMIKLYDFSKQKEIVSILDNVNKIIDADKKQLELLDEVIKSRFIEMFEEAPKKLVENVVSAFKIGPFGSALHKNEISNSGFAFVLGTDNAVKNKFEYKEIRYINEDKYKELINYKVQAGDVIMSMMGTVGRTAVIPNNIGNAIISSHLCIIRTNEELMYPDFFQCAFHLDDEIEMQIDGIHNGSIMKGFNLKIVKAFLIKCPSLKKQRSFLKFKEQIDKSKFNVQKHLNLMQELLDKKMEEFFGGVE